MSTYTDNIFSVAKEGNFLRIEVCNIITPEMKSLLVCLGGASAPILCIQGHTEFNGFYSADSVGEGDESRFIICHHTNAKNSHLEDNYRVNINHGNIQLKKKGNQNQDTPPGDEAAHIFILPPLTFRSRVSVFNIDKIDTIAQSFQTDFYCELRLVNIVEDDDKLAIDTLLEHYQLHYGLIDFLNVSEVIGEKEVWDQLAKGAESFYTYVIKLRMKAVFNEQMEVQTFPFDIQPMAIALTFNACTSRVGLEVNNYFPSIFFSKQFQSASVYDALYEDIVLTSINNSNPSESSAGYVYPRVFFYIYFARRPTFYLSNVVMPMTLLTVLGPLSNAIEADGSPMGTGDRLSVSLTLLLTAVAYKFIVATSLPQVSYLTALDSQVLLCFAFLVLSSVENVIFPYLSARFEVENSVEVYFIICYYSAFVLLHFLMFGGLGWWLFCRRSFFQEDLLARKVMREAYQSLVKSGNSLDSQLAEFVVKETLSNKGLQKCCRIDHPKHQYALSGVQSASTKGGKVGVEEGEGDKGGGLVSAAETAALVEMYYSKNKDSKSLLWD